ncbi:MAG: type IV secretion system protein [Candidatus Moraniibacteriota bacterium]
MFRKTSKKTFGKLGLLLIFGILFLNLNIAQNNSINLTIKAPAAEAGWKEFWEEYKERRAEGGDLADGTAHLGAEAGTKAAQGESNNYTNSFEVIANAVLLAITKLLRMSGALVDMMLTQEYFNALVVTDGENIYKAWVIVRDFLNMFFMLLLLFSAFATVFQVEKYHLRKMIIMLIVMALLVNFSYPITLFVIDFSNSAMYFLVDNAFNVDSASPSAQISRFTRFADAVYSATTLEGSEFEAILLNIIFAFIAFITLFAVGLNLLIRMIFFVILLIFSPVGFTFAFFPDTKSMANDWWSTLFKYAFMGPIMVFFLFFAVMIFDVDNLEAVSGFSEGIIRFLIPVAFLWIGLLVSSKFGGSGSNMAMGMAKKVGNNIKNYGQKAAWGAAGIVGKGIDAGTGHRISGGVGGLKSKWNSFGENYKSASERRKTEAADFLGVDGANEKLVRENMKRMKDEGVSDAELIRLQGGTRAERMATALFRAENNRFDNDPATAQTQYNAAMNAVRGHQVYENQFLGGARKTNMDLVINERITTAGATTPAAIQPIIREELNRLDPDQWKDQNIQRMVANTTPNRGYIIAEGANVISGYSQQGQDNVTRNMRGAKLNAGSQGRNSGVGFWA